MYRHLLVPLDGTDLSTELVGRAVEYARATNARITFFHSVPDHGASIHGEAEIVRATSPGHYAYAFEGRARELLSKAESAARALGVPCESASAVSDKAHQAILKAADDCGCDLIFMASHGRRGPLRLAIGSQTFRVLAGARVPVLVASMSEPTVSSRAIGIIRDEHRSLAAVLHAWSHLLAAARRDGKRPDTALIGAMVRYLEEFPVALHHPKEDEYLFRKLRERTSSVNAELDELERQHVRDHELVAGLAASAAGLAASAGTAEAEIAAMEKALDAYARFIWDHLGREEGVILPAAQRHLTEADWKEIEAAFARNADPRFQDDTDLEYRKLFSRIVNLA